MKKKDYTVAIITVVGLFFLVMMLVVIVEPERPMEQPKVTITRKSANTAPMPMPYGGRIHIEAIDQNADGRVDILSVAMKENGYVVIHKEEKGKPGRMIGVSRMLMPGLYSNRSVVLTEGTAPGEALYAMIYKDNGDGAFSAGADVPVTGDEIMMSSGMARLVII